MVTFYNFLIYILCEAETKVLHSIFIIKNTSWEWELENKLAKERRLKSQKKKYDNHLKLDVGTLKGISDIF